MIRPQDPYTGYDRKKQKEYFFKTLAYLQEHNIPFVVANLPMHKTFLAGLQAKPGYEEFRAMMAETATRHGNEIFNQDHGLLLEEFQDEDFLDGDHLCYSGAKKFSAAFADYLAGAGFRFNSSEDVPNAATTTASRNQTVAGLSVAARP